jgi:hypothetical protein
MYLPPQADNGLNGGEQILCEAAESEVPFDMEAYQNTLSGDGAESFLDNGCGVSMTGPNVVVNDNDISNVEAGLMDSPSAPCEQEFCMYTDNSIHNVFIGILMQPAFPAGSPDVPWLVGNSFSHNTINGIRTGPSQQEVSAAIYIITYAGNSNNPPQMLMNVFDGNTIAGADIGLEVANKYQNGDQTGAVVLSDGIFESDGSEGSSWVQLSGILHSPIVRFGDRLLEGYWII